jgi:hypothetical protein
VWGTVRLGNKVWGVNLGNLGEGRLLDFQGVGGFSYVKGQMSLSVEINIPKLKPMSASKSIVK